MSDATPGADASFFCRTCGGMYGPFNNYRCACPVEIDPTHLAALIAVARDHQDDPTVRAAVEWYDNRDA